jgi:hypothetical protein
MNSSPSARGFGGLVFRSILEDVCHAKQ